MKNVTELKNGHSRQLAVARAETYLRTELCDKVRELTQEIEQITGQIQDVELKAARESDEGRVVDLLAERSRLISRKEALPFLLRGTQARALRKQAAALFEEASAAKADLDAAELDVVAATDRVAELQRESEQAAEVLAKATRRQHELNLEHNELSRAAGYAEGDAKCIERGEPMKFEPTRFIGVVPDK